jgi:hypothetical protein
MQALCRPTDGQGRVFQDIVWQSLTCATATKSRWAAIAPGCRRAPIRSSCWRCDACCIAVCLGLSCQGPSIAASHGRATVAGCGVAVAGAAVAVGLPSCSCTQHMRKLGSAATDIPLLKPQLFTVPLLSQLTSQASHTRSQIRKKLPPRIKAFMKEQQQRQQL